MIPQQTKRIEFIDLAKGICIILVVISHIGIYYDTVFPGSTFLKSFRMPLYFFLSGFFFKTYNGFFDFLRRKTNKLLIPFVFFYLFTSVILSLFLNYKFSIRLEYAENFMIWNALAEFYNREAFPNIPIWFLLCLFEVNILFYLCHIFSDRFGKYKIYTIISISLLFGITGLILAKYGINLPMFIDTSFTSLPFFMMGYVINRHSILLQPNKYDKYSLIIIIVCFITAYLISGYVDFRTNQFRSISFLTVYPCGFLGVISIMFIAKRINYIPIVSYWGRYSIMILVSHALIYQIFAYVIKPFGLGNVASIYVNLTCTMFTYLLLIPFMRRCLPYVTAQKDII